MMGRLFDNLVASGSETKTKKRSLTLPVSIAIHVIVLMAIVVLPLFTAEKLPEPATQSVRAFFAEPAAPPPPPPPPPPPAAKAAAVKPKIEPQEAKPVVPTEVPEFTAPVEAPKEIPIEAGGDVGLAGAIEGVAGGMEGGVVGGVEGGVKGGVVGGTVGGVEGGVPEATPEPPKGPVRVGGQIKAPSKQRNVEPIYPDMARQARVEGTVVLECVISPQGRVTSVKVLRGIPMLDDSAVAAVRQWTYSPTMLNGVPVPVIMTVTVNFRLSS